jgi:hypothetical protein
LHTHVRIEAVRKIRKAFSQITWEKACVEIIWILLAPKHEQGAVGWIGMTVINYGFDLIPTAGRFLNCYNKIILCCAWISNY